MRSRRQRGSLPRARPGRCASCTAAARAPSRSGKAAASALNSREHRIAACEEPLEKSEGRAPFDEGGAWNHRHPIAPVVAEVAIVTGDDRLGDGSIAKMDQQLAPAAERSDPLPGRDPEASEGELVGEHPAHAAVGCHLRDMAAPGKGRRKQALRPPGAPHRRADRVVAEADLPLHLGAGQAGEEGVAERAAGELHLSTLHRSRELLEDPSLAMAEEHAREAGIEPHRHAGARGGDRGGAAWDERLHAQRGPPRSPRGRGGGRARSPMPASLVAPSPAFPPLQRPCTPMNAAFPRRLPKRKPVRGWRRRASRRGCCPDVRAGANRASADRSRAARRAGGRSRDRIPARQRRPAPRRGSAPPRD